MNKKNEKIRKLWDRGIRDPRVIAQKLGYSGGSIPAGIERVNEALTEMGLINKSKTHG